MFVSLVIYFYISDLDYAKKNITFLLLIFKKILLRDVLFKLTEQPC